MGRNWIVEILIWKKKHVNIIARKILISFISLINILIEVLPI